MLDFFFVNTNAYTLEWTCMYIKLTDLVLEASYWLDKFRTKRTVYLRELSPHSTLLILSLFHQFPFLYHYCFL